MIRTMTQHPTGRILLMQWLSGLALAWLCFGSVEAADRTLQDISFVTLPGNQIQIVLVLSSPPPNPVTFTTDSPARIAIDLQDTRIESTHLFRQVGIGVVQSIGAAEASGRTRVVVNLAQIVPHTITTEGNRLLVALGQPPSGLDTPQGVSVPSQSVQPEPSVAHPVSTEAAYTPSIRAVEDIDFRRGTNGEGRIIITLSHSAIGVDVHEQGDEIQVDIQGAQLPPGLRRRLDVTEFATPVHTIDTSPKNGNVHMVISNGKNCEHVAYQADRIFTVEIRPLTKEEQETAKKERAGYTGDRMSLNFQNIDVRAVLQLIAEFTKFNIVTSDTVQGSLSLRLNDVPWDQALDIILKSKGLAKRTTNNVIMVAPAEEIAKREKAELEAEQTVVDLAPLHTELIQINYAKASDMAAFLKAQSSAQPAAQGTAQGALPTAGGARPSTPSTLLSARGSVAVDERTNTLLIQETSEKLSEIRKLIVALDVPVRQVQIESRIVYATANFAKDLGIAFGVTGVQQSGHNVIATSGSLSATDTMINSARSNMTAGTPNAAITPPSASADRLNFTLPSSGLSGPSIAVALLNPRYLLDLELSALQSEARGELVANPRVITSDQKEATIEQGQDIPYQQSTGVAGVTAVAFKKAALTLKVKPQITPDDRVLLTIDLNDDSASGSASSGAPPIDTKKINTEVLVNNGETVVLGGVYMQNKQNLVSRVPFFSDLPWVGMLFRDSVTSDSKSELLIFMTPRILKQTLAIK